MDNNEKLLSFIVPVYNVEEYLEDCLDSLVSQDIPCDDYEIICVDDGSTDKSGEILDLYAEKFHNIIVIHKENGGVSSARNCGIDTAKGQYIWFVDADDFIKENCLSAIKPSITENKYDTIRILIYAFNHGETKLDLDKVTPSMCQKDIKNFSVTYILRREHIVNNKIYLDTKISYTEDAVFMLQVNPFLNNIAIIKDPVVYFYRQRPGSSTSQNISKKINSRINAALACEEIIQGKKVGDVEGAYYFKYASVIKIMESAIKLPKSERKKLIKELRAKNLFPLKYSSKYTPRFKKNKTSFIKSIKNLLCNFSYTEISYCILCVFTDTLNFLKRIVRIPKT